MTTNTSSGTSALAAALGATGDNAVDSTAQVEAEKTAAIAGDDLAAFDNQKDDNFDWSKNADDYDFDAAEKRRRALAAEARAKQAAEQQIIFNQKADEDLVSLEKVKAELADHIAHLQEENAVRAQVAADKAAAKSVVEKPPVLTKIEEIFSKIKDATRSILAKTSDIMVPKADKWAGAKQARMQRANATA